MTERLKLKVTAEQQFVTAITPILNQVISCEALALVEPLELQPQDPPLIGNSSRQFVTNGPLHLAPGRKGMVFSDTTTTIIPDKETSVTTAISVYYKDNQWRVGLVKQHLVKMVYSPEHNEWWRQVPSHDKYLFFKTKAKAVREMTARLKNIKPLAESGLVLQV